MKPRIQREYPLRPSDIGSGSSVSIEDQVPAETRYGAGDRDEFVLSKQVIAKILLSRAWNAGPQPIWIWHLRWVHDVNARRIGKGESRHYMPDSVQGLEAVVSRYL